MKKAKLLRTIVKICPVFIIFLCFSCKSAPPPETLPPAVEPQQSNDIWSLLRSGDESARGFFLGEIDVNATDRIGRTPLHYATENRDADLVKFLISIGANVNALDNSGRSPLGNSIERNNTEISSILVSAGANIHLPLRDSTTAVTVALDKPAQVFRSILTPASIESTDSEGRNVLHLASISGSVQGVNEILSFMPAPAVFINKDDNSGRNALDYAYERSDSKNHMEIAERLILAGGNSENDLHHYFAPAARSANYNIRRNEGTALVHFASMNDYTGLISFLMEKKIDINIKSTSGATALHEAVRSGNMQAIKILLDNKADVNSRDAKGNTPLHTGIPSHVHREVVSLLLEYGADPNLRDEHGETPLHIAIILNRPFDVIQTLLGGGSDVHVRNIEGKTPLYIAVQEKREPVIRLLLSYGSEVFAVENSGIAPFDLAFRENNNTFNLLVTSETVNQRDNAGNTLLHAAVRNRGTPAQIGRILDSRAPVNARNMDGDTALHIAVRMNQRDIGEFLILRGADIFSVNSAGESPLYLAFASSNGIREWMINPATIKARDGLGNNMLHYAAQWSFNSIIPLIIINGIHVDEPNFTGETPLFMAVKTDSFSTIRVLIDNRANLNARDTQGNSALHAAVRWNAINSTPFLIFYGIDINVHSLNGNTPLHTAVSLGVPEIETILIREGANLEVRNIDGNTPFMEAVRAGLLSSMERLAGNGADISTRNIRGDTPLHLAVGMERLDLVNMLLRLNASIHARNAMNRTPFQTSVSISVEMVRALLTRDRINIPDDLGNSSLHIALQEKATPDILRAIITQGARIDTFDNNGKTPLRLAVDLQLWESAKILSDAGADPFLAALDNKTPAELAFEKGEICVRALFSGRAINSRDTSENTILHFAARFGNPQTINILLELGANKNIRNISSEMPYDIAVRWNRRDNAEILR